MQSASWQVSGESGATSVGAEEPRARAEESKDARGPEMRNRHRSRRRRRVGLVQLAAILWLALGVSAGASSTARDARQARARQPDTHLYLDRNELADSPRFSPLAGTSKNQRITISQLKSASSLAQDSSPPPQQQQQQQPTRLLFGNSTGATAKCPVAADLVRAIRLADERQPEQDDNPQPRLPAPLGGGDVQVRWERADGEPIEQTLYAHTEPAVKADPARPLRYVRPSDGALVFEPFAAEEFRAEVHAAAYRCVATSPSRGATLVGAALEVRAVVAGGARLEVLDELVVAGNSARFRCQVPAHAAEYLQVVEWVEYPGETALTVQSTTLAAAEHLFSAQQHQQQPHQSRSQQRYFVSPKTGDLHIVNVDARLNYRAYQCRCRNQLTGELVASANQGKLIVTDPHSAGAPRLLAGPAALKSPTYEEGEVALLSCEVQSPARAHFAWFKRLEGGEQLLELASESGAREPSKYAQVANLLLVSRLHRNDSGAYLCVAKNSVGEERAQLELQVRAKLRLKLTASAGALELGKSLALECAVSGHPIQQVLFRHNGNLIKSVGAAPQQQQQQQPRAAPSYFVVDGGDPAAREPNASAPNAREPATSSGEQPDESALRHVIVIVLEPQHAGAYQCEAANRLESVQASAYIRVLADPPRLRETFAAQVLEQRQDVSLRCVASANPLPEITWSVDEQPIPESARLKFGDFVTKENLIVSYVNISQAQVLDSGLYRCTADNGQARASHAAQLSVAGPLQVKPMPNLTVVATGSLRARCLVAGHPLGEVQWRHNGRRLPANHRQRVFENGSLEVEHVERALGDEGEYVCLASEARGQPPVALGSLRVSIRAKPAIEPFAFSRSLREGQRASVSCVLSSGDLPIGIRWLRDGRPLADDEGAAPVAGVRASRVSDYASSLLFESLLAQHSANYTCVAQNEAGAVSHAAPLVVQVAPRWSIEPADSSIVRGASASVDCMASGFPPPRVTWTKAAAEPQPSAHLGAWVSAANEANKWPRRPLLTLPQRPIVSSPHLQVNENGSLNVLEARDSDAGLYMCQASNGVGAGLSKVVRLTINVAAQFTSRHSAQFVIRGEQAHLKCQARGDWPTAIHWFKGRHRLEPLNLREQSGAGAGQPLSASVASVVLVEGGEGRGRQPHSPLMEQLSELLQSSTSGYQERADKAAAGLLMARYSLASTELALNRHSGEAGETGEQSAERLAQQQQQQQQHSAQLAPLLVQLSSVLTVSQAERQDTGAFRCVAANSFGVDERVIQLVVQQPPDRIEELAVLQSELKSRSVTLQWVAPYDGNAPITNYHVQYRAVGSAQQAPADALAGLSWFNYTLANAPPPAGSSIIDLAEEQGSSSPSSAGSKGPLVSAAPLARAADELDLLQQSDAGRHSAPGNTAHPTGGGASSRPLVKLTISSLRPVTRYWFRVEAENKLGRGQASALVEAVTQEEAPGGAPTKFKAVAQSSSSVLVSWARLSDKELFGQVSGYYVAYRPIGGDARDRNATEAGDQQQVAAANLSIYKTIEHDDKLSKFDALLTGLRRSTKYMVTVQAFNSRGAGPASDSIVVKTLDMDPPKQVKLFVRQSSNCSIQLEWRPLSLAAIERQQSGSGADGPKAARVAQPVALPAMYVGGDAQVLHQTHGRELQPDLVDYYSLYQAELNERPQWQEIKLPGDAHQHTVENLRCGTRYQFYMMGVNKIGVGDQSDILDTRTLGGLPLAPDRQSTFDVENATCYLIRLDHWQDNGCPIKSFNIRFRPETSRDWTHLAHFNLSPSPQEHDLSKQNSPNTTSGENSGLVRSYTSSFREEEADTSAWPLGRRSRARRSPAKDLNEDVYVFSVDDGREDEDSFLDYPSDEKVSSNSLEPDEYDDQASATISSSTNHSASGGATLLPPRANEKQLFSLFKDPVLPTFDVSEMEQSRLEALHSQAKSQLPLVAQEWQASNFLMGDVKSGRTDKLIQTDTSQTIKSAHVLRSIDTAAEVRQDWRRVRFCNLMENVYYSVQITASNGVGETEAELRLLTSQEGLEYDYEAKRQVVGKLGGNRLAQSIAMSDRLNGLFALNQWPILLPITVTITLMTIIIIVTLLMKRNNSPGSTSTTTTTTTTTMDSAASHCQGYLDEGLSGHHHHHHLIGQSSPSFKSGPLSSITEATALASDFNSVHGNGGTSHLGGHHYSIEGNYAVAGHRDSGAGNLYQQHRSNYSTHDESPHGIAGLAQMIGNHNTDQSTNGSSDSPSTIAGPPPFLTHVGPSLTQHSCTLPRQLHQPFNTRARNVYLCSQDDVNNNLGVQANLAHQQYREPANVAPNMFYGMSQTLNHHQHPAQNFPCSQQKVESNYMSPRQIFNANDIFSDCNLPIPMQQIDQTGGQQQQQQQTPQQQQQLNGTKMDDCFLTIVEEVVRGSDNLL